MNSPTDSEMLDWLSQRIYFPHNLPEDQIAISVPESISPLGTITLCFEDDAKQIRKIIRNQMELGK